MKYDTSMIDLQHLRDRLVVEYGFPIERVEFLPKGEESYSYLAESNGSRYFVRAQNKGNPVALEAVYEVTDALHRDCGVQQVLSPYRTHSGRTTFALDQYVVAVFPYIEGNSAWEIGISDEQYREAVMVVAAVHSCDVEVPFVETFENPFERPILRALRSAEETDMRDNGYQREVKALLLAERDEVYCTLEKMHELHDECLTLCQELVPTHGDPNLANFLIDLEGELHLIDWGEVAHGPRERDLMFFIRSRFELFLNEYVEATGVRRLYPVVFEFYLYRWVVQEIADYTTRILFTKVEQQENEHAWRELLPYLPIRHDDIQSSMQEIEAVLDRVLGG